VSFYVGDVFLVIEFAYVKEDARCEPKKVTSLSEFAKNQGVLVEKLKVPGAVQGLRADLEARSSELNKVAKELADTTAALSNLKSVVDNIPGHHAMEQSRKANFWNRLLAAVGILTLLATAATLYFGAKKGPQSLPQAPSAQLAPSAADSGGRRELPPSDSDSGMQRRQRFPSGQPATRLSPADSGKAMQPSTESQKRPK
jgi:hypothetical protein